MARLLISTPRTVPFMYDDYDTYDDCMTIESIMARVRDQHRASRLYTFAEDALPVFKNFHDEMLRSGNDCDPFTECDQRSAKVKIVGQCARIAMVLQALTNSRLSVLGDGSITNTTMESAVKLSRYLLSSKLAVLNNEPTEKDGIEVSKKRPLTKDDLLKNQSSLVKSALLLDSISTRILTQKRLIPSGQLSCKDAAVDFIKTLADSGYGHIDKTRRGAVFLKRRNFESLDPDQ